MEYQVKVYAFNDGKNIIHIEEDLTEEAKDGWRVVTCVCVGTYQNLIVYTLIREKGK